MTWEHDAHLYWRRAQVDKVILGDSALHRELVAEAALRLASQQEENDRATTPRALLPANPNALMTTT